VGSSQGVSTGLDEQSAARQNDTRTADEECEENYSDAPYIDRFSIIRLITVQL